MEWPWLARMSQSEGEVESGEMVEEMGFMEKRCLALSATAD